MTLLFYAQPYDISAEGFYFRGFEEYSKQAAAAKNQFGDKIEEFEIQFIDGDQLDCELAKAWGLNQANIKRFIKVSEEWDDEEKIRFILAIGESGLSFDPDTVDPWNLDIDVYRMDSLEELAVEVVEGWCLGDTSDRLKPYIDYNAIADDLSIDFSEAIVAGERLFYQCY